MEHATSLLLALVTNHEVLNLVETAIVAVILYALRKVPAAYLSSKHKEEAQQAVEAGVHEFMSEAENLKAAAADGKLTSDEIKQLNEAALDRASQIAKTRGVDLFKTLAPEVIDLTVTKAVEALKGVKKLPTGTSAMLPCLLLFFAFSFTGCVTYPNGWEQVQPTTLQSINDDTARYLLCPAAGVDDTARYVVERAARALAVDYAKLRQAGNGRDEAARLAIANAERRFKEFRESGFENSTLTTFLRAHIAANPNYTDADVLVGFLYAAIQFTGK